MAQAVPLPLRVVFTPFPITPALPASRTPHATRHTPPSYKCDEYVDERVVGEHLNPLRAFLNSRKPK